VRYPDSDHEFYLRAFVLYNVVLGNHGARATVVRPANINVMVHQEEKGTKDAC
jgi:hypothetical protein